MQKPNVQNRRPSPFFKRQYIINPGFQLEIAGFFIGALVISLGGFYWGYRQLLDDAESNCQMLERAAATACRQILSSQADMMSSLFTMCLIVGLLFVIVGAILLSHRAAGPLFRLKKYFTDLANGAPFAPLKFRKSDYFQDVSETVNLALEKVVKNKNPNQGGFSLIEILVALGIMSALMLGIIILVENTNKSSLATRTSLAADRLANIVSLYITRTSALRNSINQADNSTYQRCVNTNVTSTQDCTAGTSADFVLLEPTGAIVVSGTKANPARYDTNGLSCTVANSACMIEVVTSFVPTCPLAAATCDQAQSLQITYIVRKSVAVSGGSMLADRTATITKNVNDIQGSATSCPVGKCIIGINSDGSIQCEP